jgi:hypothetical protein
MIQSKMKITFIIAIIFLIITGCQENKSAPPQLKAESVISENTEPASTLPANYDGPFGLKMGLTPEEAMKLIPSLVVSDKFTNTYSTQAVPKSPPEFDEFSLTFSEKSGLCMVVGVSKDIEVNEFGKDVTLKLPYLEIRSAFNSLDEAITKKYGQGQKFDYLGDTEISAVAHMIFLSDEKRSLAKVWEGKGNTLNYFRWKQNNLKKISLDARASSTRMGYLILRYEFENYSDCVSEENALKIQGI